MIPNTQQVDEFKEKGLIVSRGFFERDEIARISDFLDDLRDREAQAGGEAKYYEQSPLNGESVLVRIENVLGEHNADFTACLLGPKTIEALTRLLGEPPVLFKDKINYKLPGCRADKLHQDQAAGWNRYTDFFVTMAIAVDPNRKDNAALTFLSSGNYERALMTEEWQPLTEDDPPFSPAEEYSLIEADPGDVIFFDSYVPHGSPPNTGTRSRRNIFLTFNRRSAGDMRARYYADKWASYAPNAAARARADTSYRV